MTKDKRMTWAVILLVIAVCMLLVVPGILTGLYLHLRLATQSSVEPNGIEIMSVANDVDIEFGETEDVLVLYEKDASITMEFSGVNTIDSAIRAYCELVTGDPDIMPEFRVTIGDQTKTATFEELFEWMGFKNNETK